MVGFLPDRLPRFTGAHLLLGEALPRQVKLRRDIPHASLDFETDTHHDRDHFSHVRSRLGNNQLRESVFLWVGRAGGGIGLR